jgi:hypothetical protein
MLLGRIAMTENGIKIIAVDGSEIEFNAVDAVYLWEWLDRRRNRLAEILRRQQRQQKELDELRTRD